MGDKINEKGREKILKAGKIAAETREYAKNMIKLGMPLLEIAEKIESKILELGKSDKAKPAFPTNLSINDIAAHYTPSHDDKSLASGLLKVDLGVHIEGFIADTALSINLEEDKEKSKENSMLIEAAEKSLNEAIKIVEKNRGKTRANEIGSAIHHAIISYKGATPIINLSGHSIEEYELHSGITIPNIDDNRSTVLGEGVYAIEPFATNGNGKVYDGRPSGIYHLVRETNTRSPIARKVLNLILEEYRTLPFCSRWIVKKLGKESLLGLQQLKQQGIIKEYEQLIESGHGIVAQAEHTLLIEKDKVTVTTK